MPESITQPLTETKKKAQQIAWLLTEKHGPERFAWVEHDQKIFYAVLDRQTNRPMTAVSQLIQYLFDRYVDHSFFILRQRIYTTEPLTAICKSMIRVTAKRATGSVESYHHQISISQTLIQICAKEDVWIDSIHREKINFRVPKFVTLENVRQVLEDMKASIPRGPVLHDYNRAIVALLCDSQGQVLEFSMNNNSKNKTLHAEVCLLQDYWRKNLKPLPEGAVIYTSLKPCRMCADMILSDLGNKDLRVYFLEDDPGVLAQNTSLDRLGLLQKL